MRRNASVATLQIVGGRACLDFANTVAARRGREGPDLIGTYGDLLDWAGRVGLMEPDEIERLRNAAAGDEASAALGRAKRLRESLYRTFSAFAAGAATPEADLEILVGEAARAQARRRLARGPDGQFAWGWAAVADLDAVTLRIAHDAADLLTDSPRLSRVRECLGRNCGWLFLDTSRGGRRRWCSDADCGSPDRVARHRARRRAPPAGPGPCIPET